MDYTRISLPREGVDPSSNVREGLGFAGRDVSVSQEGVAKAGSAQAPVDVDDTFILDRSVNTPDLKHSNVNSSRAQGYESWKASDYNALVAAVGVEKIQENSPKELFFECIEGNHIDAIKAFLADANFDANVVDEGGNAPLHIVLWYGSTDVANLLLDRNNPRVDINAKTANGKTPLHFAVSRGNTEIAERLLNQDGIKINEADSNGDTPLHLAIRNGDAKLVAQLISKEGIDVNAENEYGETPLSMAISRKDTNIVKLLLQNESLKINHRNEDGCTPLYQAVINGDTETLKLLLEAKNVDVNQSDAKGNTPLLIATAKGDADVVKLLLEHKDIDPNAINNAGNTPLHIAADKGLTGIARQLLQAPGIKPDEENLRSSTPLSLAISKGSEDIVALFDKKYVPHAEAILAKRNIAHLFNIRSLDANNGKYEGIKPFWMLSRLATQFTSVITQPLKNGFWSNNQEALVEHFTPLTQSLQNINNITATSVHEAIEAGKPCSIPTGTPSHHISVSISGDWVAIGNRGDRIDKSPQMAHLNKPGTYFYNIPELKKHFPPEFIERLLACDPKALQEIQAMPNNKVLYLPRTAQKRGNCPYANGKTDIEAHLIFFAAQQKGIQLEDIQDENDPRWIEIKSDARILYRDFAIQGRVQAFNDYVENHFDENNPEDRAMLTFMYGEIRSLISSGPTSKSGCFQAISVTDAHGKEIPILDQLNPEAKAIAERNYSWGGTIRYWFSSTLDTLYSVSG